MKHTLSILLLACLPMLLQAQLQQKPSGSSSPLNSLNSSIIKKSSKELRLEKIKGQTYVIKRTKISTDEKAIFVKEQLPETLAFLSDQKFKTINKPCALYFTEEKGIVEMGVGIAVEMVKGELSGCEVVELPSSRAVVYDYFGAPEGLEAAHNSIAAYIEKNDLQTQGTIIESYVVDESTESDPQKWLTRIYYLVK